MHLAVEAARALLACSAPAVAVGRYERPERGDIFDVRFERTAAPGREVLGVSVRDVTRLVVAERDLRRAARPRGAQRRERRRARERQ